VSEEPIKLFAKMSERIPEPDDGEMAGRTALEALKKLPLVGDAAAYILSLFFNPFQVRRDEWFKELADGLEELQAKVKGFDVGSLSKDEVFVSAAIQATRIAVGTHRREKREALRNAVMNVAIGRVPDEEWQQIFMGFVEDLTPLHVHLLRYFQDPPAYMSDERRAVLERYRTSSPIPAPSSGAAELESSFPELREKRDLYREVVRDLHARRLFNSSPESLEEPTVPDQFGSFIKRTTQMADRFLEFIADPTAPAGKG
jgi:hypothetical protein